MVDQVIIDGIDDGIAYIKKVIEEKLRSASIPLIVGIAGPSASGKGVLRYRLEQEFPGSATLEMDNYFLGTEYMNHHGINRFDDPRAVELSSIFSHVAMLKEGIAVNQPIYSFALGERIETTTTVHPAPVIFIEGLFVLGEPIGHLMDVAVFVDAGTHSTLWRRILRDVQRTGQTESQILDMFLTEVYPAYRTFILPTREGAGIIVVNEMFPEELGRLLLKQYQMRMRVSDNVNRMAGIIASAGFFKAEIIHQHDTRLIPPTAHGEELLRFRIQSCISDDGDATYTLSYKSPINGAQRGFCEFPVTTEIRDALIAVGYRKGRSLTKYRTIYRPNEGGSCEISLDEFTLRRRVDLDIVTGKGESIIYLEIRADSQDELYECIKKLGRLMRIEPKDMISASYWDINELMP